MSATLPGHAVRTLLLLLTVSSPALAASTEVTVTTSTSTSASSAQALLPFKARLSAPDASGRGMVTIDADTLEIEVKHVFSKEAHAFAFGDARAVHLRRGLFHTDILLDMRDDSRIRVRTRPRQYDSLRSALKGRISKGE